MRDQTALDQLSINTIRTLAMDGVQRANSGHPGMPMGAAAMAYVLWTRFMKHSPAHPDWPDRDRFVLSAGHGSMLLYSLLHLTGYDVTLDDLRSFRQWGSRTPGHPERGCPSGVEVTTGPLGQGVANSVGMAIAERHMAAQFNRSGHTIVDHHTYAIVSDGDLMEGIASEAASLAGHFRLGKLIYLYDDNDISIEGSTDLTFTEDVAERFSAYGWHVQRVDGDELEAVASAIEESRQETQKPSLIVARTHIGYGSPNKQDSAAAHGSPLGVEEVRLTKERLGWPLEPDFHVPDEALAHFRQAVTRGEEEEAEWRARLESYASAYPQQAERWKRLIAGNLPSDWDSQVPDFSVADDPIATRAASGKILNGLARGVPELIGGSADLAPSNNTLLVDAGDLNAENPGGRNLRFGVREHAMAAIANGMAAHGGLRPYVATFLVFSDYMRPAIRLAAMMGLPVVFVFTHDSIAVGEDGPTHQPIEQLMSLREVPNLTVIRPSDATETREAWRVALLNSDGPTALVLTRQKLPVLDRASLTSEEGLRKGGYVLWQSRHQATDLILIATGSEVSVALQAGEELAAQGVGVRVVSMPSWELFDRQPAGYRESVLSADVRARIAVEAGITMGWEHYVGLDGDVVGMEGFGASAPGQDVLSKFGFTVKEVVARARGLLR
jgi:transketolase